ncbi:hypothetical protein BAUCODRAFT_480285 [Baudoinia panamericana UAMH 10762]|uniref:TrmE-type G domain-containing protein n=1 Tax=Baudoinia panamericana (strain UAMH 10762) TaxID=717646 RepID=M2MIR7_BAUPA|nr:uncharacterized protein BAUCODRAFT_480285 [Baudoinia panamericana UAMH 10762]EMC96546.1 hypothetical protein BAUCODRAFT_480285 [Baudoinia panamericana UAMH 10762]
MRTVLPTWRSTASQVRGLADLIAYQPFHRRSSVVQWRTCITHRGRADRFASSAHAYSYATPSYEVSRKHDQTSTIYALSTAPGRAAIAVIRISGYACLDIYRRLCPGKALPKPRYATVRTLHDPNKRPAPETVLDANALIFYFPAPRTATGEDVLELHVHGGTAVVKAVLSAVPTCASEGDFKSIRYAEAGEFTKRAFLNGRLDLTQVEALGDTLAAITEEQRRLSMRATTSTLSKQYEEWRRQLLYARGELEALIDFSEDQHFDESPAELCRSVSTQVRKLRRTLQIHSANATRGELLRNGISVSLLGAPNAGKSSLLNRIVGREAAIVSQEAGTTRDVVEVGLDIGGFLCQLGDTAGLRKAQKAIAQQPGAEGALGLVEEEGMRRARARASDSDVVIVVTSFEAIGGRIEFPLYSEVVSSAAELVCTKNNVIVVINKTDLAEPVGVEAAVERLLAALPGLDRSRIYCVSCKEAENERLHDDGPYSDSGKIQTFLQGLIVHFQQLTAALSPEFDSNASIWQESLGASERHRLLLEECLGFLDDFLTAVQPELASEGGIGDSEQETDIVVAAEYLRGAANCLAKVTGKGEAGDVEEVLGVVFEKFCVGK